MVVVSSSSSWEANDDAVDNEVADGIDMVEESDEDANADDNATVAVVGIENISSIVDVKQHDEDEDEDG